MKIFLITLLICCTVRNCINAQINKTFNAFNFPSGIAADSKGNLYVVGKNNKIVKITTDGVAHDFAGSPGGIAQVKDGKGTDALFSATRGIAIDANDNLYIADYSTIRKVTPDAVVTTLVGIGTVAHPEFIAIDNSGIMYVTDQTHSETRTMNIIRKILPDGTVTDIKNADGTLFRVPWIYGLTCDKDRNLYVSVKDKNSYIVKITPDQQITTIVEGLAGPKGIAINKKGEIFFADGWAQRIFKIANNKALVVAGGKGSGYKDGLAKQSLLYNPFGIAFDKAGNLFIVDASGTVNGYIRKLSPEGKMSAYCKHVFNAEIKQYEDPRNTRFR